MPRAYTVSFGRADQAAGGFQTLFICPPEDAWVLRDIVVSNDAAGDTAFSLYVDSGGQSFPLFKGTCPAGQTRHQELRQRLIPGDKLWFYASAGASSMSLTGYHLLDDGTEEIHAL